MKKLALAFAMAIILGGCSTAPDATSPAERHVPAKALFTHLKAVCASLGHGYSLDSILEQQPIGNDDDYGQFDCTTNDPSYSNLSFEIHGADEAASQ